MKVALFLPWRTNRKEYFSGMRKIRRHVSLFRSIQNFLWTKIPVTFKVILAVLRQENFLQPVIGKVWNFEPGRTYQLRCGDSGARESFRNAFQTRYRCEQDWPSQVFWSKVRSTLWRSPTLPLKLANFRGIFKLECLYTCTKSILRCTAPCFTLSQYFCH